MNNKLARISAAFAIAVAIATGDVSGSAAQAQDKEPIQIGFSMGLTGSLASAGKSALIAMRIWAEDTNEAGGLLGRPVELIYYDDQGNPANVPAIYTKLLDVDHVDLIVSSYGTNFVAPLMPIAIQRNLMLMGLFGLDNNKDYQYDRYFSMVPIGGATPSQAFSSCFFEIAKAQGLKTVAIAAADAEFAQNAADGALANAQEFGLEVVYNQSYPPSTPDFTPIIRAMNATDAEVMYFASYPADAAGMVRAFNEVGFPESVKLAGGGLVGMQYATLMESMGPMLNGIVNYDYFVPASTLQFEGIEAFLEKYSPRAKAEGVDPLGYYLPPYAYAILQVLGQAVTTTKSLDHDVLADHIRDAAFDTVVGTVEFGPNGEWVEPRVFQVQFHDVEPNNLEQFTKPETRQILCPKEFATGEWVPYHQLAE